MRLSLPLFLAVSLAALPASAQYNARSHKKKPETGFGLLMSRISKFLSADAVQRSHVTAIAAVRGGIPKDQGEDLDQRLLDRTTLLRTRLLAEAPAPADLEAARAVYQALAVSQWTQALELDPSGDAGKEAKEALKLWAKAKRTPPLPGPLKAALSDAKGLTGKALVDKGWGGYCRALTPEVSGSAAAPGDRIADSDTAALDEALKAVSGAWLEKKLGAPEEAQAHLLAGSVYEKLSNAPLKAVALPPAQSLGAPAAQPERAQTAPALAADAPSDFNARAIYGKAARAVVLIMGSAEDGGGELGSGSVIDRSGRVLTNAHVVIRDSTQKAWPTIRVYLKPAKMTGDSKKDLQDPIMAKVAAFDRALDLAVLKLETVPANVGALSLADPERVSVGDQVAAIGHPEQGGLWTLTTGVISTVVANLGGIQGKSAFQTDASINRGNSGGPLLNASGEIIGVNTLMSRKAADGLAITAVNFAVKSDVAKSWLEGTLKTTLAFAPPASSALDRAAPPIDRGGGPSAKPAEKTETAAAPSAPQKQMVSEGKPFTMAKLIEEEIKEMENLEDEMHREVLKHMDSDQ